MITHEGVIIKRTVKAIFFPGAAAYWKRATDNGLL